MASPFARAPLPAAPRARTITSPSGVQPVRARLPLGAFADGGARPRGQAVAVHVAILARRRRGRGELMRQFDQHVTTLGTRGATASSTTRSRSSRAVLAAGARQRHQALRHVGGPGQRGRAGRGAGWVRHADRAALAPAAASSVPSPRPSPAPAHRPPSVTHPNCHRRPPTAHRPPTARPQLPTIAHRRPPTAHPPAAPPRLHSPARATAAGEHARLLAQAATRARSPRRLPRRPRRRPPLHHRRRGQGLGRLLARGVTPLLTPRAVAASCPPPPRPAPPPRTPRRRLSAGRFSSTRSTTQIARRLRAAHPSLGAGRDPTADTRAASPLAPLAEGR